MAELNFSYDNTFDLRLRGIILDRHGRPLKNAVCLGILEGSSISLSVEDGSKNSGSITDENGSFSIDVPIGINRNHQHKPWSRTFDPSLENPNLRIPWIGSGMENFGDPNPYFENTVHTHSYEPENETGEGNSQIIISTPTESENHTLYDGPSPWFAYDDFVPVSYEDDPSGPYWVGQFVIISPYIWRSPNNLGEVINPNTVSSSDIIPMLSEGRIPIPGDLIVSEPSKYLIYRLDLGTLENLNPLELFGVDGTLEYQLGVISINSTQYSSGSDGDTFNIERADEQEVVLVDETLSTELSVKIISDNAEFTIESDWYKVGSDGSEPVDMTPTAGIIPSSIRMAVASDEPGVVLQGLLPFTVFDDVLLPDNQINQDILEGLPGGSKGRPLRVTIQSGVSQLTGEVKIIGTAGDYSKTEIINVNIPYNSTFTTTTDELFTTVTSIDATAIFTGKDTERIKVEMIDKVVDITGALKVFNLGHQYMKFDGSVVTLILPPYMLIRTKKPGSDYIVDNPLGSEDGLVYFPSNNSRFNLFIEATNEHGYYVQKSFNFQVGANVSGEVELPRFKEAGGSLVELDGLVFATQNTLLDIFQKIPNINIAAIEHYPDPNNGGRVRKILRELKSVNWETPYYTFNRIRPGLKYDFIFNYKSGNPYFVESFISKDYSTLKRVNNLPTATLSPKASGSGARKYVGEGQGRYLTDGRWLPGVDSPDRSYGGNGGYYDNDFVYQVASPVLSGGNSQFKILELEENDLIGYIITDDQSVQGCIIDAVNPDTCRIDTFTGDTVDLYITCISKIITSISSEVEGDTGFSFDGIVPIDLQIQAPGMPLQQYTYEPNLTDYPGVMKIENFPVNPAIRSHYITCKAIDQSESETLSVVKITRVAEVTSVLARVDDTSKVTIILSGGVDDGIYKLQVQPGIQSTQGTRLLSVDAKIFKIGEPQ